MGDPTNPTLPEIMFVHPIPGFTDLRRFVLVRIGEDDEVESAAAAADARPAGAAADRPRSPRDAAKAVPGLLDVLHEAPLYELRSLEQADVRFMVAVPKAFFGDYEIELADSDCDDLGLHDPADALVLVMLTVGRDVSGTTANLLAPIVINARTRDAAQVILTGSDWPVRAPLG